MVHPHHYAACTSFNVKLPGVAVSQFMKICTPCVQPAWFANNNDTCVSSHLLRLTYTK